MLALLAPALSGLFAGLATAPATGPFIESLALQSQPQPPPGGHPRLGLEPAAAGSQRAAACSFRHPLCVEDPAKNLGAPALAILDAADRAWSALTVVLGSPAPDGDDDGVWHIALADGVDGGGDARLLVRDPFSPFDRASSAGRVDRSLGPGCALDLALARAVARGSLFRAAPATDEASARAEAETLARLATPCSAGSGDVLTFQSRPERTLVAPGSPSSERGSSAFFAWLDVTFGAKPGALVTGLWALAPTKTPFESLRWAGSPTGFDVLRTSLAGALWPDSTLDDVVVRFAVERALMEPSARLAWHLPWPAQPRRLASPEPVAPTGSSYVLVDHAGVAPGSKLRLEAAWEDYGRLRWVVVKLDAAGRSIGQVPITSLDRGTNASITLESIDDVDRLLVVCVNVGSTEHKFDPDQGEWEPHGWLLTLAGE